MQPLQTSHPSPTAKYHQRDEALSDLAEKDRTAAHAACRTGLAAASRTRMMVRR